MQNNNYIVIQGWMCNELKLKGNDLLVYALIYGFSQDGESTFSGSRSYIANMFNISLPTVDKALNNLVSRDLIEKIPININGIIFNQYKMVYKDSLYPCKDPLHNNIVYNNSNLDNNISKNTDIQKKTAAAEFNFGGSRDLKQSLYQNCIGLINEFTDIESIHTLLVQYLDLCMEMKCIKGANQWKGMLNKLDKVQVQCHPHKYEEIIQQSIDHAWKTFYPIKDYNNKNDFNVRRDIEMISEPDDDNVSHKLSDRVF